MPDVSFAKVPLAERMRPSSLEHFFGQEHLVGQGKILRQLIEEDEIPSLIFWGPPSSGKTTLATIIADAVQAHFVFFSAVLAGVKDIRNIIAAAKERLQQNNTTTILFVDEIHRFNKGQQDAFLPHVESGLITLIGATTENPSFQIIAPLLSRCQVLQLHPLDPHDIEKIILQALQDSDKGLGRHNVDISEEALLLLAKAADGDCRRALNFLETTFSILEKTGGNKREGQKITASLVGEVLQHKTLRYDRQGEEHYNLISALHKSLRDSDPDGAVYWLNRMLISGEEPLYIMRRMIRFASEDIGNADPQALQVALNCHASYHLLGSPEGELALFQAATYLATAPKSNAVYMALKKTGADIKRTGSLPVPLHLRNAVTSLMGSFGYGKGYKYAHDQEEGVVEQEHLPSELSGKTYYLPSNRGYEAIIKDRLMKWRKILQQRAGKK